MRSSENGSGHRRRIRRLGLSIAFHAHTKAATCASTTSILRPVASLAKWSELSLLSKDLQADDVAIAATMVGSGRDRILRKRFKGRIW